MAAYERSTLQENAGRYVCGSSPIFPQLAGPIDWNLASSSARAIEEKAMSYMPWLCP